MRDGKKIFLAIHDHDHDHHSFILYPFCSVSFLVNTVFFPSKLSLFSSWLLRQNMKFYLKPIFVSFFFSHMHCFFFFNIFYTSFHLLTPHLLYIYIFFLFYFFPLTKSRTIIWKENSKLVTFLRRKKTTTTTKYNINEVVAQDGHDKRQDLWEGNKKVTKTRLKNYSKQRR